MRGEKRILGGIIVLSVVLRILAVLYLGDQVVDLPGTADQISYHNLALRVMGGHGFTFGESWWPVTPAGAPTAHWSFLYTFYLVVVYSLFGGHSMAARLIQAVLVGVLHPYLTYLIGKRVFSAKVGLWAAGLTALYTYFIYYSATLMTESFYIISILGSIYLAILITDQLDPGSISNVQSSKRVFTLSLALGLTLGTTVLLRQLFLLFIPFLFIWMWLAHKRKLSGRLINSFAISGSIVILLILPFTIYNFSRFDRFVLLNTNAGFAFFWANHPIYGTHFIPILPPEMGSYRDLIPPGISNLDEAALDQELLRRSIRFILDDPRRYVLLSLSRIPAYFMFWPSRDSGLISNISRVAGFGILLPFMIYGLALSAIPSPSTPKVTLSSPTLLLWLFCFVYTAIHILSWTLVRYRLPVDAVLLVFAGLAFDDVVKRLGSWLKKK